MKPERDPKKLRFLEKRKLLALAKKGDANVQYELARTYLDGSNVEIEYDEETYDKAAEWFKRAADNDHLDGLNAYSSERVSKVCPCPLKGLAKAFHDWEKELPLHLIGLPCAVHNLSH